MKVERAVLEKYPDYLNDESGLVNGKADAIYFPENEEEVCQILKDASKRKTPVTVSGGGTGISGGRVPLEGWILATDLMRQIPLDGAETWVDEEFNERFSLKLIEYGDEAILIVPVAMRLKSIQNFVRERGWFYPPDPTERSSFIGGNVSTNASGARTFKFGSTRDWVAGLRVVLPDGRKLALSRKKYTSRLPLNFLEGSETSLVLSGNYLIWEDKRIPLPTYKLPKVTKNVAGVVWTEKSEPLDLFIGANGIFGVVTAIALRLIRPPQEILSIFAFCPSWDVALKLVQKAQVQRASGRFPVPLSVELLDEKAVDIMRGSDGSIPPSKVAIILEQDASSETIEEAILFWVDYFDEIGISSSSVAQTHKEIEHHKFLRHLIPETVNRMVRSNGQPKLGTDYSVPSERFQELLDRAQQMGKEFETFQKQNSASTSFGYIIWAHAGDSHLHLNFLPRTPEEVAFAKKLMVRLMKEVVAFGGSIAAEHGLGKKKFEGKPALFFQYGEEGIRQIQEMKQIVDPDFLLNRGNLVPPPM